MEIDPTIIIKISEDVAVTKTTVFDLKEIVTKIESRQQEHSQIINTLVEFKAGHNGCEKEKGRQQAKFRWGAGHVFLAIGTLVAVITLILGVMGKL